MTDSCDDRPSEGGFDRWHTESAGSVEAFRHLVGPLLQEGHGQFRTFSFRGQASASWPLQPSLTRELRSHRDQEGSLPSVPGTFERALLLQLKQKAHLYAPVEVLARGSTGLHWMVLGRHYGLPTRLLDWTYSPYVAAWMACSEEPSADGCVWVVSVAHVNSLGPDGVKPLMDGSGEHLLGLVSGERKEPPLLFFTPPVHNQRSALQQGIFSIAADGLADHDELIADALDGFSLDSKDTHLRVTIPADRKRGFIRELRRMNVTAETLSPDLDGLCRELLQVLRDHPEELAAVLERAAEAAREDRGTPA